MKLSFNNELLLACGIICIGFILSIFFQQGIFSNAAWIVCGLIFIFHPVCPEFACPKKQSLLGCQVAGIFCILAGVLIKYSL